MKTVSKVCLGFALGCTVLFGGACLACNGIANIGNIVTIEKTDADGKTTAVTTVNSDGKTTTTTYNVMKKDITFTNKTDLTFEDIEMESNLGDEVNSMDEMDEMEDFGLRPNSQMNCESVSFHEDAKTVDFEMEDDNDNTYNLKGVDVSNIKDMDHVNFVITQQGNTISVNIAK